MDVKQFVARRIDRLKEKMEECGLDAVILQKPENVFYFSNFNPVINSHPAIVVVTKSGEPVLLVHCIRCDHAKEEGAIGRVELYGKWGANVALAMKAVDAIPMITGPISGKIGLEFDYDSYSFCQDIAQ